MTPLMIVLIAIGAILLFFVIVAFFAGVFLFHVSVRRDSRKRWIFSPKINRAHMDAQTKETRMAEKAAWLDSVKEEEVSLINDKGLTLKGYIYTKKELTSAKKPTDSVTRWAILCHGYAANAQTMLHRARGFSNLGFTVLLPDAEAHGASEGKYIGMGWHDRNNLIKWIEFIVERDATAEIVLYGVSMGAATVMMAIGEDLPQNVKAAVEDCGFTSAWAELAHVVNTLVKLPPFPILYIADLICRLRAGYGLKQADAVGQLKKSKVPLLCIHGKEDAFSPVHMVEDIYAATKGKKSKLIVENAGHCGAEVVGGQAYWTAVYDFVAEFLTIS